MAFLSEILNKPFLKKGFVPGSSLADTCTNKKNVTNISFIFPRMFTVNKHSRPSSDNAFEGEEKKKKKKVNREIIAKE